MDQPGRYFYLRDRECGDAWPAFWQPVGKPLDQCESTCRHVLAYSVFESRDADIASEATYFVPLGQTFEYWRLRLTNEGDRKRQISTFTFCEFSNQWDTYQDQVNLQYSLFIVRGEMVDGLLRIAIQDSLTPDGDDFFIHDLARHAWMAQVGEPVSGYDTSREAFLSPYRGYHTRD
jgi:cellobiose phosphorylase